MNRLFRHKRQSGNRRSPADVDALSVPQRTATPLPSEHHEDAVETCVLGSLLEDGFFLTKVLSYLIDFGLHECRLVCRTWNDVCKQLPVKLSNVPFPKIHEAPDIFPNAIGLSASSYVKGTDPLGVFDSLYRLPNLKRLELCVVAIPIVVCEQLPTCFAALSQLEFLCLWNTKYCLQYVYESLRCLTLLTRLELMETWPPPCCQIEPLTELKRLQELRIHPVLQANQDGDLVFPPTSRLIRLEIMVQTPFRVSALRALDLYATWLQSLSLGFPYSTFEQEDKLIWTHFTQSKELNVHVLIFDDSSWQHFLSAVEKMVHLTSLHMKTHTLDKNKIDWQDFSALTDLKSLKLDAGRGDGRARRRPWPVPNVPSLTSLSLVGAWSDRGLDRLTKLVDLELGRYTISKLPWTDSLWTLRRLAKLVLRGEFYRPISASILLQLANLKSLSLLDSRHNEAEFLPSLASLPRLTEFCFTDWIQQDIPHSFLCQLTALSQLRRLGTGPCEDFSLLDIIKEGSFPHLMYLEIRCKKLTAAEKRLVFKRCPCLRSLEIEDMCYGHDCAVEKTRF